MIEKKFYKKLVEIELISLSERENEQNPKCLSCGQRFKVTNGLHLCAECEDDDLQRSTGCRYGKSKCLHEDCKEPAPVFGAKLLALQQAINKTLLVALCS